MSSTGITSAVSPSPDSDVPPIADPDPEVVYETAPEMERTFRMINFDPSRTNGGDGVTVAYKETSNSLLSSVTVTTTVTTGGAEVVSTSTIRAVTFPVLAERGVRTDPSANLRPRSGHDKLVGTPIGGRIGTTVYGIAFNSTMTLTCCGGLRENIGELSSSEAFVINNSYGFGPNTLTISGDRCRKFMPPRLRSHCENEDGEDLDVLVKRPMFDLQNYRWLGSTPDAVIDFFERLCVSPDSGVERICVWSAGNSGLNSNGVVGTYTSTVQVFPRNNFGGGTFTITATLAITVSAVIDALEGDDLEEFKDFLYERFGYKSIGNWDGGLFRGHFVIVAAMNRDGDALAAYSNGCGDAKEYCLAAPGHMEFAFCDPAVDDNGDGLCPGNRPGGTSFAAPIVTGSAALLKSTFPNLDAPQVVTLLLTTAQDLGEEGVDDEYGHGLLDLGEALMPQGEMTSRLGVLLSDTSINPGTALGSSLSGSRASFGMVDMHGRTYMHYISQRMQAGDAGHGSIKRFARSVERRMSLAPARRMGLGKTASPRGSLEGGIDLCDSFCLGHRGVQIGSLVQSDAVTWAERHMRLGGGSLGLVFEAGMEDGGGLTHSTTGMFFATNAGDALLRLEAGALEEKDTFVGGGFEGALALQPGDGEYMSARFGLPQGDVAIAASYTLGRSSAGLVPGSYVREVSDVTYDAMSLEIGTDDWEFHYIEPLASTGGGMRIESVSGYAGDSGDWSIVPTEEGAVMLGKISHDNWRHRTDSHWIDFATKRRERRFGITAKQSRWGWDLTFGAEYVTNSPREFHSGDEVRAVLGLSMEF